MKMRKIISTTGAIILALSLTACGGNAQSTEKTTADTTPKATDSTKATTESTASSDNAPLTIWWGADSEEISGYIEGFKDIYPEAEIVFYSSEDLKTQIRLAIDSGTAPDVFQVNAGTLYQEFQEAGALMDLTGIIGDNEFIDRINPDYIKQYTTDGKYYAFPTAPLTTWQNLYVNRDLLEQAGITKDPENLTELIEVASQLRAAGIAPLAFGDKDGWPALILLGDFFAQQVQDLSLIDKINSGEMKLADCTEFVNALESVISCGQNKVFMDGWTSSDHSAAVQTFAAGQAAFLYNGSWWSTMVDDVEDMGFELDVIWLPTIDGISGTGSVQMSSDMGFAASAASLNKEGVAKFLDYMSLEESSIFLAKSNNSFSVYPGANEKIERAEVFNSPEILEQFEKSSLAPFFDWVFPTSVTELLKVKIVECIDGTTNIDKALEELQTEMDKNLNTMPAYAE